MSTDRWAVREITSSSNRTYEGNIQDFNIFSNPKKINNHTAPAGDQSWADVQLALLAYKRLYGYNYFNLPMIAHHVVPVVDMSDSILE